MSVSGDEPRECGCRPHHSHHAYCYATCGGFGCRFVAGSFDPRPPVVSGRQDEPAESARNAAAEAFEAEYHRQLLFGATPNVEARRECLWNALTAATPILVAAARVEMQQDLDRAVAEAQDLRDTVETRDAEIERLRERVRRQADRIFERDTMCLELKAALDRIRALCCDTVFDTVPVATLTDILALSVEGSTAHKEGGNAER